jgi:hypothetical protein
LKNYKFLKFKTSVTKFWFSDKLIDEILYFIYEFRSFIKFDIPDFNLIQEFNGLKFEKNKTETQTVRSRSLQNKEKIVTEINQEIEKRSSSTMKNEEKKITKPTANLQKIDELEENDMKCPLCLEFLLKPISLKCGHTFCMYCLEYSIVYNPSCPICRKSIDGGVSSIILEKNINKELQDKIAENVDVDMIKKREEGIIKDKAKSKTIIIEYGNTSILQEGSVKLKKRKYTWTLFVKVVSNPLKYNPIKLVEFDINPHLDKSIPIKVATQPFEFERHGTYDFPVNIKIIFLDKLKIQPYTTSHELKLGPTKSSRQSIIKLT